MIIRFETKTKVTVPVRRAPEVDLVGAEDDGRELLSSFHTLRPFCRRRPWVKYQARRLELLER
jgi:hypothetical protein